LKRLALLGALLAASLAPVVSSIAAPSSAQTSSPRVPAIVAAHRLAELQVINGGAKLDKGGTLTGTAVIENAGTARARGACQVD